MLCGKEVSILGLGTGRLASLGAGYTHKQAADCLHMAAEHGINLIDTADSYGSGDCERLLGQLLSKIRHPFFISTKAGYTYCRLPALLSPLNQVGKKILHKLGRRQCFQPAVIRKNLELSLRRLRRDRVDFFFLHDPTPEALDDDKLLAEILRAKQEGKIGHAGISTSSDFELPTSHDHPLASLIQTQVNPWGRKRFEILQREVVANHVFGGENLARNQNVVRQVAAEENMTVRQLLVAYAANQAGVRTVLVGTGRAEHLQENLGGVEKKLSPESLQKLEKLGQARGV